MTTTGDLPDGAGADIERFLDDQRAAHDVPGASVAVFDTESLLFSSGLGTRSVEMRAPTSPRTLYNVGSISKIVTAIGVLQLVERDAIALSDSIAEHTDFLADAPGEPVTVEELLAHASGMPSDDIALRETVVSVRDLQLHVDGAAQRRLTEDPPRMYYNSGYKLLGALVAAVDGRPYEAYVKEEILDPLGMERSTFDPAALEADDDATTGHRREDDEPVPSEPPQFESVPADGGLIISVEELPRLLRAIHGDGSLDGERVLEPATTARLRDSREPFHELIDGTERGYGYGLMFDDHLGDTVVGHGGTTRNALAYAGILRERGLGVAVAFNSPGLNQMAVGRGVLAIAAGEAPTAAPGIALERQLAALEGTYESYRDGPTATVEADDGHLTVTLDEYGVEFPAIPESLEADNRSFYTVERGGERQPVEFRETEAGMTMLYTRARFDRV